MNAIACKECGYSFENKNEIPIHIVVTRHRSFDVDRPDDIQRVSQILAEKTGKMS